MDGDIPPFPMFLDIIIEVTNVILNFHKEGDDDDDIPPLPIDIFNFLIDMIKLYLTLNVGDFEPHIKVVIQQLARTAGGFRRRDNDFWFYLEKEPRRFWHMTGELPQSLEDVVHSIAFKVEEGYHQRHVQGTAIRRRQHTALSTRDRVLMFFIWLRVYPTFDVLGSLFNTTADVAYNEVHHILTVIHEYYVPRELRWHDLQTWQGMKNKYEEFPNVVAIIDGTPIRINMPSGPLQRMYYRRDKGFHFINLIVVVDTEGYFVFGRAGFFGHNTDAACWEQLPRMGPGRYLNLPQNSFILADSGFPQEEPLICPIRHGQIVPFRQRINMEIGKKRVYVEHRIRELKIYKAIGSKYRGNRAFVPLVCNVCMALTNRRRRRIAAMRLRCR